MSKPQTFYDFINNVCSASEAMRQTLMDRFMQSVNSFPIIEQESLVHFIYKGDAMRITVPGDANSWDVRGFPMKRIFATNLWYRSQIFEPDARLDYKFLINGKKWTLDPLNPNMVYGGFGANSELRMPHFKPPEEIYSIPPVPRGTLQEAALNSRFLDGTRRIQVYTPPGYNSGRKKYPVILINDGIEYIHLAKTNRVIDYLIAQHRIVPIIAVFIAPEKRTAEYAGELKKAYSSFIIDEVLPYIDSHYSTLTEPRYRAILGASNGGNSAIWFGLHHPNVIGNIAAQSSHIESSLFTKVKKTKKLDLKFYFDLGTYDLPVLIPLVRRFVDLLYQKGYTYQYHEYHQGHSWLNWGSHIDNALEMFFQETVSDQNRTIPDRIT